MPSKIFQPGLLDGQVAIVSGGGSGLGRAAALELASLGARVLVCGRRHEPLDETVRLDPDGRIEAQACDIREEDQVAALVDGVTERHGRIDLLVNNAGGQYLSPAEDITPKGFRTVIRLNVEGTWLMTHAVATRSMIPDARGGKILNVTLSPHRGLPGMAHSSAARAAVENLTRVLSIEWARFQIKLTAIASGHFATDAIKKYPQPVYAAGPRRRGRQAARGGAAAQALDLGQRFFDLVDGLEVQPECVHVLVREVSVGADDEHGAPRPDDRGGGPVRLRDLLVGIGEKGDRDAVLGHELRVRVHVLRGDADNGGIERRHVLRPLRVGAELLRAHRREVARVEEQDDPLAAMVGEAEAPLRPIELE